MQPLITCAKSLEDPFLRLPRSKGNPGVAAGRGQLLAQHRLTPTLPSPRSSGVPWHRGLWFICAVSLFHRVFVLLWKSAELAVLLLRTRWGFCRELLPPQRLPGYHTAELAIHLLWDLWRKRMRGRWGCCPPPLCVAECVRHWRALLLSSGMPLPHTALTELQSNPWPSPNPMSSHFAAKAVLDAGGHRPSLRALEGEAEPLSGHGTTDIGQDWPPHLPWCSFLGKSTIVWDLGFAFIGPLPLFRLLFHFSGFVCTYNRLTVTTGFLLGGESFSVQGKRC